MENKEYFVPLVYETIQKGKYEISNTEKIRIIKNQKIMKPFIDIHGYVEYGLTTDTFTKEGKRRTKDYKMHVLMLNIFGDKDDIKYYNDNKLSRKVVINHKDGVKTNNNINNLEVVTQQVNIQHAIEMGLFKTGLKATSFYWLTDEIFYNITKLFINRTPTNIIIKKLNLLQYGNNKKQLRRLINNMYSGIVFKRDCDKCDFQKTKINVPRPITYTDDDVHFVCKKIEEGYRDCEIVKMIYNRLGYDGNIKTKRRYKSFVYNTRRKIHRTDISSQYNF